MLYLQLSFQGGSTVEQKFCFMIQMAKSLKVVYNQFTMNSNFFWQPTCIQLIPNSQNTLYFSSLGSNTDSQLYVEPSYQELQSKCRALEQENSRLKQQLSILQLVRNKKSKRIVKRRKQEELEKSCKCSHQNCKKQYASTLALNLHIRNKHPHDLHKDHEKNTESLIEQNLIKSQGHKKNL